MARLERARLRAMQAPHEPDGSDPEVHPADTTASASRPQMDDLANDTADQHASAVEPVSGVDQGGNRNLLVAAPFDDPNEAQDIGDPKENISEENDA